MRPEKQRLHSRLFVGSSLATGLECFAAMPGQLLVRLPDEIHSTNIAGHIANPVVNFMANHTGDAGIAAIATYITYKATQKTFPHMTESVRLFTSIVVPTIPLVLAETINFPYHMFGYADVLDIPYGFLNIVSAAVALSSYSKLHADN